MTRSTKIETKMEVGHNLAYACIVHRTLVTYSIQVAPWCRLKTGANARAATH